MTSGQDTFLQDKKQRVEEQKRLFRQGVNPELALNMLKRDETNFLITVETSKILVTLEASCYDMREGYGDEKNDWLWGEAIAEAVKSYQMGSGVPADFRGQFIEALKALVGGGGQSKEKNPWTGV